MSDIISRQALKDTMYEEVFLKDSDEQRWDGGCWIRYKMFERVIDSIPTIDAVPVVRCKDCVWCDEHGYCDKNEMFVENCEWFCADGERKDDV